ncbi:DUF551 domain-containing protein [Serratia fonticola]|uniref:DUF551 domain-containing protein n=1 Tax=Serratia fonticola TaxID=47917 RepID=UPI003AAB9C48
MKELDDFTVERLTELSTRENLPEVAALARIALAAKTAEPVGSFHIYEGQVDGTTDYVKDGEWPIDTGELLVYAAPVLNSPELPDGWIPCAERMPEPETPVLIMLNGTIRKGAIFWEHPTFEEGGQPFKYWDDPDNDGQDWEVFDVTHWQPLPAPPTTEK